MDENIYSYLGLPFDVDEAIVIETIESQLVKWHNMMPSQPESAIEHIECLMEFKKQLSARPDWLKEQALEIASPIFGIDFGTTYSGIAVCSDNSGKASPIIVDRGLYRMPSAVYLDDNMVYVGEVAKSMLESNPNNGRDRVKSDLGNPDISYNIGDSSYSPLQFTYLILKKLFCDVSDSLKKEIRRVSVAYPVRLGCDERQELLTSFRIHDLRVEAMVPEPIAVAYHYNLDIDKDQAVMVFDLGGQYLDVSVLKISDALINIAAYGCDNQLGGNEWDEELMKFIIEKHRQETNCTEEYIYSDKYQLAKLRNDCEEAKKFLSYRAQATIRIGDTKIKITSDEFECLIQHLLDRIILIVKDTLERAYSEGVNRCEKILMAGSMSFLPHIQKRLKMEFPDMIVECEEPAVAIACGATMYANRLQRKKEVDAVPVMAKGLVIGASNGGKAYILHNVVPKWQGLPYAKVIHAKKIDDQNTFHFTLFEHDCVEMDCDHIEHLRKLMSRTVTFSKPSPKDSPVDILLQVNVDGHITNINVVDVFNDEVVIVDLIPETVNC